jgi:hypothetical protein
MSRAEVSVRPLFRAAGYLVFVSIAVGLVACGPAAGDTTVDQREAEMDHELDAEHSLEESHEETEAEHGDPEHDEADGDHSNNGGEATVPNNGAVIHIVAPEDGAVLPAGQDIVLEVETENFVLGEDGNHWHVFVDGSSWGMVVGGNHDQPLRGLTPGMHTLSVYMSLGSHEQLEDGDSISITIE